MNYIFTCSTGRISLIFWIFLIAGCFGNYPKSPSLDKVQSNRGIASWYGPSFHGKPSASGEPYDMWALTAAHRTLPFNTRVQVKKVGTGETVTVRINDRGPFINGRIIDLSYAAARELSMIGEGTAEVILTILNSSPASIAAEKTTNHFWVQAGAFTSLTEAMILRERLAHNYAHVRVQTVTLASREWHRVQIGSFDSKKTAQTVAGTLKKDWGVEAILLSSN
jgi:rare lipoprotein A